MPTEKDTTFNPNKDISTSITPFLFLALDLPPVPLYQDEKERDIVPQVPLTTILSKFDGKKVQEVSNQLKRYSITRLPQYLILHIKRFTKNSWTISSDPDMATLGNHYDLLANICHEGESEKGAYKVHVRHRGTEQWYQVQDLIVEEIMPQMIFMSESYIQIWERKIRQ
ncbi:unnamed protein product [Rhizopus stolonifer]